MSLRSIRVGRLAGIPIGVQPLWLVIAALITVSLGAAYYPARALLWWRRGDISSATETAAAIGRVLRVHRAGEGAPYTGLKPAGLDHWSIR